jgi:hypothetical protein
LILFFTNSSHIKFESSLPTFPLFKHQFKKGQKVSGIPFKKGHVPANKGIKGICYNTGRTHFKKGHHPICGFKKGHKPWTTGKKMPLKIRQKISQSKKGSIPWNKGLKFTHS